MSYNYWPENTKDELYIAMEMYVSMDLEEILESAKNHFKNENLTCSKIKIETQYIHTSCIGFDSYDPSDYTIFIIVTLKE